MGRSPRRSRATAPSPRTAYQRRARAGAEMAATTSSPSCSTASSVAKTGMPRTRLCVPSIGSTIQRVPPHRPRCRTPRPRRRDRGTRPRSAHGCGSRSRCRPGSPAWHPPWPRPSALLPGGAGRSHRSHPAAPARSGTGPDACGARRAGRARAKDSRRLQPFNSPLRAGPDRWLPAPRARWRARRPPWRRPTGRHCDPPIQVASTTPAADSTAKTTRSKGLSASPSCSSRPSAIKRSAQHRQRQAAVPTRRDEAPAPAAP